MVEPLLAWDQLLKPIPGSSSCGVSLRNTPAYDEIPRGLKPQEQGPGGAAPRDAKKADYRALIRSASHLLATQSKDLDLAVWLTEALVREERLPGLSEGLLLIQRLLETFWDGIYPALDQGDEGFRAKPINRLNTAFTAVLPCIPVTFDGRTIYEYNRSADVPVLAKAEASADARKKREQALEEGATPPEEIQRSVAETSPQFYEELEEEIRRVRSAAELLQKTCEEKFRTGDRPALGKFFDQIARIEVTVEAIRRTKPAPAPVKLPDLREPETPPPAPPKSTPAATAPPASIPAPPEPAPAAAPRSVLEIAAELRSAEASNPVPYLLVRSWQFGPLIERGAVDEDTLHPPATETRTALRRALLNNDWFEVLDQTELAMASPCGACWLDLQQYSARACTELGYTGAAHAIRGITAAYLRAVPDLPYAVMPDGSPVAAADTLAWIRTEVQTDPARALTESLADVRPSELPPADLSAEPDAFEVASNELEAGRFSEAFRVLAEAASRERSGRGRTQRRIQLAKICMEGEQIRLATAILQEIFAVIEARALDCWEPPEFIAPPMAMLYRCLDQQNENPELCRRIYDKLCAVNPERALELTLRP